MPKPEEESTAIVAKEQGASAPMFEARAATASDATRRERDVAVERAQKAAGDVVVEAAKINDTMHYIVIAVPKAPSLTGVCGVVWSSGMRRDARVSTVDAVARALKDVP